MEGCKEEKEKREDARGRTKRCSEAREGVVRRTGIRTGKRGSTYSAGGGTGVRVGAQVCAWGRRSAW